MNTQTKKKKALFKKYGSSEKDTGSTEVQLALFTERIKSLTDHLKDNRKDFKNYYSYYYHCKTWNYYWKRWTRGG